MAIESDERIAEPLSLGCPVRHRAYGAVASGEQALKSSERFMSNGDVVAAEKLQGKDCRGNDAIPTAYGELKRRGPRAQKDMLAPEGVEKDVLDVRTCGNKGPWKLGGCAADDLCGKVHKCGCCLGETDEESFFGRQFRIHESR